MMLCVVMRVLLLCVVCGWKLKRACEYSVQIVELTGLFLFFLLCVCRAWSVMYVFCAAICLWRDCSSK